MGYSSSSATNQDMLVGPNRLGLELEHCVLKRFSFLYLSNPGAFEYDIECAIGKAYPSLSFERRSHYASKYISALKHTPMPVAQLQGEILREVLGGSDPLVFLSNTLALNRARGDESNVAIARDLNQIRSNIHRDRADAIAGVHHVDADVAIHCPDVAPVARTLPDPCTWARGISVSAWKAATTVWGFIVTPPPSGGVPQASQHGAPKR